MDTLAYIAAFVAFIWCGCLSERIHKLEQKLKSAGIGTQEKNSLKGILEKSKGKSVNLQMEDSLEIMDQYSLIEDIDEEWLLVKAEKSGVEKLIRIDSIENVQFKK